MKKLIVIIVLLCVTAGDAAAFKVFDGRRKGFVLTFGIGPGATKLSYTENGESMEFSSGSLYLESKLGIGFTNQFQVCMVNKMSIFEMSKMLDDYEDWFDKASEGGAKGILYLIATPIVFPFIPYGSSHTCVGLSAIYYLRPSAPSLFIEAGFGGGIMYNRFNDKIRGGRGGSLAVGYEFRKHIQPKIQVMYGQYNEEGLALSGENYERETSALSVSLSVDYSFY
mgnify:CR=1 FL=1